MHYTNGNGSAYHLDFDVMLQFEVSEMAENDDAPS